MTSCLNAAELVDASKVSLKKDEHVRMLVRYDDKEKFFKFRWTLYKNGGLVIHRSYDREVSQNILYLRNRNQSFRVELKPRGADFYNVPYLLVKFKKFDYEKREAIFEIYISDANNQIILKYLKNS